MKMYKFTFADGYYCYVCGMSKQELKAEIKKHGKLISKTLV